MPPRAVFTRRAPGFIIRISFAPISPSVSGVRGRWIVTKSDCTRSASRVGIISTPISFARSTLTYGSNAITRIPNPPARAATSEPTRPRPTSPIVLPASSTPSHRDRSHRPSMRSECACGTLRACANRSASVCSAALMMLDWGALTTMTPRRVVEAFERHLERREATDDVQLAHVTEMPDPEDLPFERTLSRRKHAPEIRPDAVADRIRADALRRPDRRHRPVVIEPLAEQIETEGTNAVLDGSAEALVPQQRGVDAVLEVQLQRRVQ